MSINALLDAGVCPPQWVKLRAHRLHSCTDIQFDRDLIGTIRLNGNIPPGAARTFLHTDSVGIIAWKTFSHTDIPAGNNGDYLQTIAGLVAWAPPAFAPASITPGTARQLLQTNAAATAAEWTSNVDIPGTLDVTGNVVMDGDLAIDNELNVLNGDATVANGDVIVTLGDVNVNGGNINVAVGDVTVTTGNLVVAGNTGVGGDLYFAMGSGTTADLLVKTGATTQQWAKPTPASLTQGVANQLLVTNSAGTAANWASNVTVPGTLAVTGTTNVTGITTLANNLIMSGAAAIFQMAGAGAVALLNETRVYGQLKFGAVAGVAGTVPVSDASGIPSWKYAQYFASYYDSTPVDMNNGGGGARTLLTAATANVSNSNITYLAGTFTLAEAGHYSIRFQTNATTVGAGAQTLINIKTNGNFAGSYTTIPLASGVQSVVLEKSYMLLAASTVQIVSQQLAAGVINTSAADANAVATTLITITKIGPYI